MEEGDKLQIGADNGGNMPESSKGMVVEFSSGTISGVAMLPF